MNFEKINLAIIGAGKWGFNHVRTAVNILEPDQITVCDSNTAVKKKIFKINNQIKFTTDLASVHNNKTINSVIVATPAETHYAITLELLKKGKNVLVEKPITLFTSEAKILNDIAFKNNCKLMVGHVLLYHPAIMKMKELIDRGMMGKLQYIYSNRLNLGTIRTEENILWSFAPHDISIIQFLTGSRPISVTAKGASFLQNKIEDTTLTYLEYPGNVKAHIFVSWLNPFKEQKLVVIGEHGMFVFEDSRKDNKLIFYPKGVKKTNGSYQIFDDGEFIVKFSNGMPLTQEHKHFYDCIINNKKPLTDGEHALEVVEILEKATQDLHHTKQELEIVEL